jgi:deoxyribose-phosphate aldolase
MTFAITNLNQYIEHTNLNISATEDDIIQLCSEAIQLSFYGVVVNQKNVQQAVDLLKYENIKVISVCDFPLGVNSSEDKISEALKIVEDGADEIDLVANIDYIKDNDYEYITNEICLVRRELPDHIILKVIIEAGLLTDEQIRNSVKAIINSKADFLKTSTGMSKNASIDQFKQMVTAADRKIKLKAAGGIRTYSDCQRYITAGADRIGTSSSVSIIKEIQS